jgi:O-antigen ligase
MSGASLGHHASRGALAVVLAAPLGSVFTRPDVPGALAVVVAALAGVTIARPAWGLVAAVGLLPLAKLLHLGWGGPLTSTAVSEILLFTFVASVLVRLPRAASDAPEWIRWPALALGAAVATSLVVELAAIARVAPDRPFLSDLWTHVTVTYWTDEAGNWGALHDGLRWLAVISLAVAVERVLRVTADLRRWATVVWLGAAACATTFTVVRVVEIVTSRDMPVLDALRLLLSTARVSVLHPDQNAAGSIFGLLLVAAVVIGVRRRLWWLVAVAAPYFLFGFVFAQSRAAIGAVALVAVAFAIVRRQQRGARVVPMLVVATVVVGALGAWMVSSRSHIAAADAVLLRVELARVGLRMAARYPEWGVGLGDYVRTSRRFLSPNETSPSGFGQFGENAHNNFLQVAVELGIPAGVSFAWLVMPIAFAVWGRASRTAPPEFEGLALGVNVFLVSALLGHPLLIPEVAILFFVAVGLAASQVEAPRWMGSTGRPLALAAAALYAGSLAWRLSL